MKKHSNQGIVKVFLKRQVYGARLVALGKKDGGVRPIAIGLTLRRLAAKVVMRKLRGTCAALFQPHQLGVGLPRGGEIAAHALRHYVSCDHEEDKLIMKIEYYNAFNTLRRDEILSKVAEHVPAIFKMVWQAYSSPSNLYFNDEVLQSQEGIPQGCPLGPYLFALSTMDLMEKFESEVKIGYLDDFTLAGKPESVLSDFQKILAESDSLGLKVNDKKCELFAVQTVNGPLTPSTATHMAEIKARAPRTKILPLEDLTLLGAPILEASGEAVLMTKLENLKLMVGRLSVLDAHDQLYLLKNCFALPKLNYFLRSAPCFKNSEAMGLYDEELRLALKKIMNGKLDEKSWEQCCLPTAYGGVGVRCASDISLPAFLSSAIGAREGMNNLLPQHILENDYQALVDAEIAWKEALNNNDAMQPENPHLQASWDLTLSNFKYEQLLENAHSQQDKARLRAVASEHASDWLNAQPLPALGLKMDDSTLQTALYLRLGIPFCVPFQCRCGNLVDSSGRHGLSCRLVKGTFPRHAHANSLIQRALAQAHIPSVLEPKGLTRNDNRRGDGYTLFPWSNGKSLLWDFTCRDTLAASYVDQTSQEAGKAAEVGEKAKFSHYQDLSSQFIIVPVATETLGTWGKVGLKFLKDLGKRIIEATGEKRSTCYLFQTLSMAVQRGNVASIKGSVPDAYKEKLDEIFDL